MKTSGDDRRQTAGGRAQSLLGKDASDQVRDFERMEEEERRLIASLQATQAQQQAAYSELEGVLGSAQASRVR